jgi:glycosyltransferase involved in cell wall biosynthesis
MPVVSVIVPNYNHARFLSQRLDSILAQTFKDYELIVLDDASTDNSREVIERYAAKHPMRLVFNERNSGSPFAQWQKGAALATGKYLWIAESDDFADPNLLQTLISMLDQNPNVGLAYCQSRRVNAEGVPGELSETRAGMNWPAFLSSRTSFTMRALF